VLPLSPNSWASKLIEGRLAKKGFTRTDDEYQSATDALKEACKDFNESLSDAHLLMNKGIPLRGLLFMIDTNVLAHGKRPVDHRVFNL